VTTREVLGGHVAPDWSASTGIAAPRGRQRDDEDPTSDFRDHEPMGGRLGRVEEGIARPDLLHIGHAEVRMLEEVGSLMIDLERIGVVKTLEVQHRCTSIA
jgi:hypothetical protein